MIQTYHSAQGPDLVAAADRCSKNRKSLSASSRCPYFGPDYPLKLQWKCGNADGSVALSFGRSQLNWLHATRVNCARFFMPSYWPGSISSADTSAPPRETKLFFTATWISLVRRTRVRYSADPLSAIITSNYHAQPMWLRSGNRIASWTRSDHSHRAQRSEMYWWCNTFYMYGGRIHPALRSDGSARDWSMHAYSPDYYHIR